MAGEKIDITALSSEVIVLTDRLNRLEKKFNLASDEIGSLRSELDELKKKNKKP